MSNNAYTFPWQTTIFADAMMTTHLTYTDDETLFDICKKDFFTYCSFDLMSRWDDALEEKYDWKTIYNLLSPDADKARWLSFVVHRYYGNSIVDAISKNQDNDFGEKFLAISAERL